MKAINGKFNSSPFDINNWESYCYDILSSNNEKIEIKRWGNSKNLNINFKNILNDDVLQQNLGYYSYYDTFYNNCYRLDYLICADIKDNIVTFKRIIDAKTFKKYLIASNVINQYGSTHFYADIRAKSDGNCIDI
jgi:hypothetical protein